MKRFGSLHITLALLSSLWLSSQAQASDLDLERHTPAVAASAENNWTVIPVADLPDGAGSDEAPPAQEILSGYSYFIECATEPKHWVGITHGLPFGLMYCYAQKEVELLEEIYFGMLAFQIERVLETLMPDWVYEGYRYYEYVEVHGSFLGGSSADPDVTADVWGIQDSQFCGMWHCACDDAAPCFDGSTCQTNGGQYGVCVLPLPD